MVIVLPTTQIPMPMTLPGKFHPPFDSMKRIEAPLVSATKTLPLSVIQVPPQGQTWGVPHISPGIPTCAGVR